MIIKPIIKNNHDLKKNGYQIIWKLHKLETKKGLTRAYNAASNNSYFFVLSCKNLVDWIRTEYSASADNEVFDSFDRMSNLFLTHLDEIAKKKGRINKRILANYLHAYTRFFNTIIEMKVPFFLTKNMMVKWNVDCIMPYVASWG